LHYEDIRLSHQKFPTAKVSQRSIGLPAKELLRCFLRCFDFSYPVSALGSIYCALARAACRARCCYATSVRHVVV